MDNFKIGDIVKFNISGRPTVYVEILTIEENGYRVLLNGKVAYYSKLFFQDKKAALTSPTENILYVQ